MITNVHWVFLFVVVPCSTFCTVALPLDNITVSASTSQPTSLTGRSPANIHDSVVTHETMPWCTCPQGSSYRGMIQHCGLDFYHGDSQNYHVVNRDECIDLCAATPGCVGLSYESPRIDGLHGFCYLKDEITVDQRPKIYVLGMYKAHPEVPYAESPCPEWWCGMSTTAVESSTVSAKTSSEITPFTTHHTSVASSTTKHLTTAVPTALSSSSASVSSAIPATMTSSLETASLITTESLSTNSTKELSSTQDESAAVPGTSIGPPFWFSDAHPCYPTKCSFPVTTIKHSSPVTAFSQQLPEATTAAANITVTGAHVTTTTYPSKWNPEPSRSRGTFNESLTDARTSNPSFPPTEPPSSHSSNTTTHLSSSSRERAVPPPLSSTHSISTFEVSASLNSLTVDRLSNTANPILESKHTSDTVNAANHF